MAFEHTSYGLLAATTQAQIHNIFTFVSSSAVMRFVSDVAQSSQRSTDTGGAGAYNTGTIAYTDWGTNSFMVVEPVNTYPGGGRWQAKILRASTTVINIQVDFSGSWNNRTFSTLACTSSATQWNKGSAPAAGDLMLITAANSDSYNGASMTYSYLRVLPHQTVAAEGSKFADGFYVGGYIPCLPNSDTRPACMLARIPKMGADLNNQWGALLNTCLSRTPVEYAHTTLDLTTAGKCQVQGFTNLFNQMYTVEPGTCESGSYVDTPMYLVRGSNILGAFDTYTMRCGANGRADGSVDSSGKWTVVNDIMMRTAA